MLFKARLRRSAPEGRIWLGITVLTQITRLHFKLSKISLLIPHIYISGIFVNFWGILGYIWGFNSFSQRISEIYGNRKF